MLPYLPTPWSPEAPGTRHHRFARLVRSTLLVAPIAAGLVGAWLGMLLFGSTTLRPGPLEVELASTFGPGRTEIELPPLGKLTASTHTAPIRATVKLQAVNVGELTDDLGERTVPELATEIEQEIRDALPPYALRVVGVGVAGGLVASIVIFRKSRRALAAGAATALIAVGGSAAGTWLTYRPEAFQEPTFSGSLELAPQLVGPMREVGARIEDFRIQLNRIVAGGLRAYAEIEPRALEGGEEIRVLHIADIHLSPLGMEFARQLAEGFEVDAVLDTGDITSWGFPLEARITDEIPRFGRPYVFVRGNHDSPEVAAAVEALPRTAVLDRETVEVEGLLIYGMGHPVFTEDATRPIEGYVEQTRSAAADIADDLRDLERPPDIVAVHDDRMTETLAGSVPLVVSGHYHVTSGHVADGTTFLRVGSTGGAGINVITPEGAPHAAQILYFRRGAPPQLLAIDRVEQSPVTGRLIIERHLAPAAHARGELEPTPTPTP